LGITASNIATPSGADIIGPAEASFERFAFDSRRIHSGSPSCFIAIQTKSADGHRYIAQAIEKGASVVICRDPDEYVLTHPNTAFVVHEHPLEVLRNWAALKRAALDGPVLAITGSNGKTVVKEWMYQLLGNANNVHRTPGSFNSEIGVPLTLSSLKTGHSSAIVEVGIDRPGVMVRHEDLAHPKFGVFTNLGDAHNEHFDQDDQKFEEKWQLFARCERVAMSRGWYDKAKTMGLTIPNPLLWGTGEALDPSDFPELPFSGGHHLENAMNAVAGAILLGATVDEIRSRISTLEPIEMRMQMRSARGGGYLLEDTYSSDLESLRWALEELNASAPTKKKWAVLSHLSTSETTHQAKSLVDTFGLDRIWWISKPSDLSDLVQEFSAIDLSQTTLLIKGQRRFKLESFAATLRKQYHSTWAEINLGAMRRNLQKFKAIILPQTKVMAMVKASSYGAGTLEVARFLQDLHVDYLGVAFAQEALSLRAQGVDMPILVLNVEPEQVTMLAQSACEVELFSRHQLLDWLSVTRTQTLSVHLKVNTGMNRLGFAPEEIPELLEELKGISSVEVTGVFTHLAAANLPAEDDFTIGQLDQFSNVVKQVKAIYPAACAHALNTHGIHRFPSGQHNMVRLGLGLYGVGAYGGVSALEEVLSWKCKISQIGSLSPGDSLGYSRSFIAESVTHYATLPVGYADGLSRSLSRGRGAVYIRGVRCEILGNVCMDMCMVNITGLKVKEGEEVELLGPLQSADAMAKDAGTISYEVMTGIGSRVPRLYLKD
jgi:alanine racemase